MKRIYFDNQQEIIHTPSVAVNRTVIPYVKEKQPKRVILWTARNHNKRRPGGYPCYSNVERDCVFTTNREQYEVIYHSNTFLYILIVDRSHWQLGHGHRVHSNTGRERLIQSHSSARFCFEFIENSK